MKGDLVDDIWKLIFGGISLFLILSFVSIMLSALNQTGCSDYKTQIDNLNGKIIFLENQSAWLNSTAETYKNLYYNLTTTNITKNDFVNIQNNISYVQYQIDNINNVVNTISQDVINIQNVKNIYFQFSLSVAINLLSFGFLLFDWAFFSFELSKGVGKRILEKTSRLRRKKEKQEPIPETKSQ